VTRNVALLVNPTAGKGRGEAAGRAAAARLMAGGVAVERLVGNDAEHAIRLGREVVAHGIDALVAVGGDGMLNLALQCVAGTDVPLGIIPSGTGNDFATLLGIPAHDNAAAADVIVDNLVRTVDAARITHEGGGTWFAGVMSSGFDSAVNERANRMAWPKGRARYNLAIMAELSVFKALPFTVVVDDVVHDQEAMLVAVGNGVSYGGGMKVTPGAQIDDGLLHVTVLGRVSKPEFLRVFPRVYKGTHVEHPAVTVLTGREIRLSAPGAISYADGERIAPLPVTATCVPGALHVLVPPTPPIVGPPGA
jgi:diacylglycerol kinase (ATP)